MKSNIKNSKPINLLILDIEGGHGGSSKSIFHTVEYLNKRIQTYSNLQKKRNNQKI